MRFICTVTLYLLIQSALLAQYPDNKWLLGYSTIDSMNNGFGLVELDFTNNQLVVGEEMEVQIDLNRNISIISTPAGDSILFYFNGLQVNNGAHELAVNGEEMYTGYSSLGYDVAQGSLILPWPGQEHSQFLLLSMFAERNDSLRARTGYELNFSIVTTDPQVEVIEKNIILEQGSLHAGQLTATRHANGRDWWIIWPYWDSNRYMRFLFTPQGLVRQEDQYLSRRIESGAGQSRFSPNGRYFVMHNGISGEVGIALTEKQQAELTTLAFACPLEAGNAVYRARTLLRSMGDYVFDDEAACGLEQTLETMARRQLPQDSDVASSQQAADWQIYPNPATHQLWITGSQMQYLQGIQLLDGLGRVVMNKQCAGDTRMQIQLPTRLEAGVYFLRLQLYDGDYHTSKLFIQP